MAKYYAPNFSGLLPLFDGKSAAGGKLYAYRASSSIPAPLFNADGVELGSWVSIDSNGCADFLLDSALSYKLIVKDALGAVVGEWDNVRATNAPGGMDNPMTATGDIIVGGTGGTATALPVGANGEVLTSDGTTASWAAPAAQPGDHLVKASATDASDPGSLNDKLAVLSPVVKNTIITPQGDEKLLLGIGTSGVTNGYVLTKGMTGADWAAIPTQTGDHKTAVDGSDTSPDYLAAKLAAGSGISLTNTGSAVEIAADAQTGDHQLLVSATDAAAGYLGAKLVPGSNITITPQTDGDGVQTLEISATGGGGGGGSDWSVVDTPCNVYASGSGNSVVRLFQPLGDTIRSIGVCLARFKVGTSVGGTIFVSKVQLNNGDGHLAIRNNPLVRLATKNFTTVIKHKWVWVSFDADVDVSATNCEYVIGIGFSGQPNPGENVAFQLSACPVSGGTDTYNCEYNPTLSSALSATAVSGIYSTAYGGKFCLGVSSAEINS